MTQESEFAFDTMTGPMALMVGMFGMGGSGKTESAVALATGMAYVRKGPVAVIDTEAGRARHKLKKNGGRFDFRHIDFQPDHSTERYLKAIDFAISQGVGAIVVDSWSHEHEGIGGALEQHAAELQRMGGQESMNAMAWAKPKRMRKAVVNRILQARVPIVFCFRAKQGVDFNYHDPKTLKRKPRAEGLVPIGDRAFFYDMTVAFCFRAGSDGHPDWRPDIRLEPETRALIKCPGQFRQLLGYERDKPPQINEDMGVALARWAEGHNRDTSGFEKFHAELASAPTLTNLRAIGEQIAKDQKLTEVDKNELRDLAKSRAAELSQPGAAAAQ